MEPVEPVQMNIHQSNTNQIQVQKPILVAATDQMPDHTYKRLESSIISIDSNITDNIIRKVINV